MKLMDEKLAFTQFETVGNICRNCNNSVNINKLVSVINSLVFKKTH